MGFKKNKLYRILQTTTLVGLFSGIGCVKTEALSVKEVYDLPGVQEGYRDKDVPVALEVTEAEDGLKVGAYLYRHIHQGVDFYAPWTPDALIGTDADKNGTAYANWGFWNMSVNKAAHSITATYYYDSGTIKEGGASGLNGDGQKAGTLPAKTVIKIYAIDSGNGKVYVHADDYSQLSKGSSTSDIIALDISNVTFNGTKKSIMYSGYSDDTYLQNFKRYGKYVNNTSMIHHGMEKGRWTNSSATNVPESVRGKVGEWRYIGYNRYGDPLDNPYFLGDTQNCYSAEIYSAIRRHTPWDKTDGDTTGESDPATAYSVFIKGMASKGLKFEYDKLPEYSEMKDYVVEKLFLMKAIQTKNNVKNEFSLRTNAYKQGIVMKNQRKYYVYYGVPFIEGTLRDLYVYSMEIWEIETNTKIASLNGSATSSKVSEVGQYKPGRSYEVRIRLGNGADATPIIKSLETQFGLIYNADAISNTMAFKKTKNQKTQRQGDYGGLTSKKGSKSNEFIFKFSTSTNQTGPIDVYGFVGFSHTGVDNLNYNNDLIGIRLSQDSSPSPSPSPPSTDNCVITNSGKTKTCGSSDIVPVSIQLIDENGVVQYTHDATNGITKQNAIIPGKKYKIKYNAKVSGGITVSTWVDAVNDDPNTPGNEYREGYWENASVPTYKIPLTYTLTRPIKNPSTTESYNGGTVYFVDSDGSEYIPISNNKKISYTTEEMVMQYPKLTTNFKITSTNSKVNSDRDNDSLSTTVTDHFDISISDLSVAPIVTYTNGTEQKVSYNISYNASLTIPTYVHSVDYMEYVQVIIKIHETEKELKVQLSKGSNIKTTHVIENVKVPASGNVTVTVELNKNRLSYENGGYSNNKISTTVKTEAVRDPGKGSVTDTVKTPVQNDNSPDAGGNANNNCLIPRTKNTWTSRHRKYTWTSTNVSYKTLVSGETVTFKKYNLTYNNSDVSETYKENYNIQKIMFKSKETEGKGENGWINLLSIDPKERELAIVKAGYGFELKIIVNYNTDALSKRSWTISNNGSSGTNVSAQNAGVNHGMEAIFLELPGTESTRKILSNVAYGKAIKGLNVTKTGTTDDTTWTYTIKSSNTTGSGSSPKIYIPTNMKNGDYKLKIYTTPLPGVGSVNKNKYSALCDRKEVVIKVKGTASDDLNSNIIQ